MVTHGEDLSSRVIERVRQVLCGLHGHDTLLQFGEDRMFLRCVSCGHETPGWDLDEAPPTAAHGHRQPSARPMMQHQLSGERRVA
ncbi:MAG TPA: hypothetical protein VGY48_09075 [Vicinamibacterales bacterium]|jgi:hypothetical protein|nr:hypothetical protein [Vicinamibacterales bacterium]